MVKLTSFQADVRNRFHEIVRTIPNDLAAVRQQVAKPRERIEISSGDPVQVTAGIAEYELILELTPTCSSRAPLVIRVWGETPGTSAVEVSYAQFEYEYWSAEFVDEFVWAVVKGDVRETLWMYRDKVLKAKTHVKLRSKVYSHLWRPLGGMLLGLIFFRDVKKHEIVYEPYT
jgi:hypothetical protein